LVVLQWNSPANIARIGQVSIEVNGIVINISDCVKSLGIEIDSKLSWVKHINFISRKYHFMAKSLYPLKPVLSEGNMQKIVEACLISFVNYMVVLWGLCRKVHLF
jgi:hypothetical protein